MILRRENFNQSSGKNKLEHLLSSKKPNRIFNSTTTIFRKAKNHHTPRSWPNIYQCTAWRRVIRTKFKRRQWPFIGQKPAQGNDRFIVFLDFAKNCRAKRSKKREAKLSVKIYKILIFDAKLCSVLFEIHEDKLSFEPE